MSRAQKVTSKRKPPAKIKGLSTRERNTIFHLLMDRAVEERELHGGDTWRTRWMENLAERVSDARLS
jgi:hypothetical protein